MKNIMTVAAGLAVGYLIWQYLAGAQKGTVRGQIHRSVRDRKLTGVCGGIAEYLNTDPTIVRLGFIVFSLLGGSGLLVYFIAALIMPAQPAE